MKIEIALNDQAAETARTVVKAAAFTVIMIGWPWTKRNAGVTAQVSKRLPEPGGQKIHGTGPFPDSGKAEKKEWAP